MSMKQEEEMRTELLLVGYGRSSFADIYTRDTRDMRLYSIGQFFIQLVLFVSRSSLTLFQDLLFVCCMQKGLERKLFSIDKKGQIGKRH